MSEATGRKISDLTALTAENITDNDLLYIVNGSESKKTTVGELRKNFANQFLGDRTFKVAFGKIINNTVLTSTTCYMPFKASEVNVTLTGINIPGLGNVEIDYKGAAVSDYGFFIQCTTAGAIGMSTLESQVATVAVSITAK